MKSTPPVMPGLPVLGNLLDFQKNRFELLKRGYQLNGPVFTVRLANKPVAVLIGPDYQQIFFMETDKKLSMHKSYRFLRAMFGDVAFTAPPHVYQKHRPVLHAPFKREKMLTYVQVMQTEVQRWLDSLGESGEMELTTQITQLVQKVAGHAFMGDDFQRQMGTAFWEKYTDLAKGLDVILPPNLPLPKFRRRDRARAEMRAMLQPLIAERRAHSDQYDDFLQDFINANYKDGTPVEDEVIESMILGLMFAGHETTAGQAAWTIIELLRAPDYLPLVHQEIAEKLSPGAQVSVDLLADLPHIEWAVREVERLHPSADMLLRTVEEELEVGDYRIPPGWMVLVSSAVAHRLPDWFANPDVFDPLRFAPDRAEDKGHRFALIGFGGGVHKCTGMNFAYNEMMTIVGLLFQQFDLELLTANPQIEYGMGASRPTKTMIRYRRKAVVSR